MALARRSTGAFRHSLQTRITDSVSGIRPREAFASCEAGKRAMVSCSEAMP